MTAESTYKGSSGGRPRGVTPPIDMLLERLVRYLLRPSVCTSRLRLLASGLVAYDLKSPWSDGTTGFLFSPTEFIEKLAALVPPPAKNLIRFHGVFAPRAKLRRLIVPGKPRGRGRADACRQTTRRIPWSELLRRVFQIDILHCERCGGRREVIGMIKSAVEAHKILQHLGLDTDSYEPLPARASPQLDWAS